MSTKSPTYSVYSVITIVALSALLGIAGFKFSRWLHYKLGYEAKVEQAIEDRVAPLEDRIEKLEAQR